MKRRNKTIFTRHITDILRDNEGTSLILVTIIAIIIIASVIILRMTVSTLLASADMQYNQDQAYEAATSMGKAIDALITAREMNLKEIAGQEIAKDQLSNITTAAEVVDAGGDVYIVRVTSHAGNAEYVYSATYTSSGSTYQRVS